MGHTSTYFSLQNNNIKYIDFYKVIQNKTEIPGYEHEVMK
jgi:hypothetical protein